MTFKNGEDWTRCDEVGNNAMLEAQRPLFTIWTTMFHSTSGNFLLQGESLSPRDQVVTQGKT